MKESVEQARGPSARTVRLASMVSLSLVPPLVSGLALIRVGDLPSIRVARSVRVSVDDLTHTAV